MSSAELAIKTVLINEGGYSNDPKDRGGATNRGISLRFLKGLDHGDADINGDGHVDEKDIKLITGEKAVDLYKRYFWDHYRVGWIADQQVANKMLNFYVNMRGRSAAKILQRAANEFDHNLVLDGLAGRKTFGAVNACPPEQLLPMIKSHGWEHYKRIIELNPPQVKYRRGWRKRALETD